MADNVNIKHILETIIKTKLDPSSWKDTKGTIADAFNNIKLGISADNAKEYVNLFNEAFKKANLQPIDVSDLQTDLETVRKNFIKALGLINNFDTSALGDVSRVLEEASSSLNEINKTTKEIFGNMNKEAKDAADGMSDGLKKVEGQAKKTASVIKTVSQISAAHNRINKDESTKDAVKESLRSSRSFDNDIKEISNNKLKSAISEAYKNANESKGNWEEKYASEVYFIKLFDAADKRFKKSNKSVLELFVPQDREKIIGAVNKIRETSYDKQNMLRNTINFGTKKELIGYDGGAPWAREDTLKEIKSILEKGGNDQSGANGIDQFVTQYKKAIQDNSDTSINKSIQTLLTKNNIEGNDELKNNIKSIAQSIMGKEDTENDQIAQELNKSISSVVNNFIKFASMDWAKENTLKEIKKTLDEGININNVQTNDNATGASADSTNVPNQNEIIKKAQEVFDLYKTWKVLASLKDKRQPEAKRLYDQKSNEFAANFPDINIEEMFVQWLDKFIDTISNEDVKTYLESQKTKLVKNAEAQKKKGKTSIDISKFDDSNAENPNLNLDIKGVTVPVHLEVENPLTVESLTDGKGKITVPVELLKEEPADKADDQNPQINPKEKENPNKSNDKNSKIESPEYKAAKKELDDAGKALAAASSKLNNTKSALEFYRKDLQKNKDAANSISEIDKKIEIEKESLKQANNEFNKMLDKYPEIKKKYKGEKDEKDEEQSADTESISREERQAENYYEAIRIIRDSIKKLEEEKKALLDLQKKQESLSDTITKKEQELADAQSSYDDAFQKKKTADAKFNRVKNKKDNADNSLNAPDASENNGTQLNDYNFNEIIESANHAIDSITASASQKIDTSINNIETSVKNKINEFNVEPKEPKSKSPDIDLYAPSEAIINVTTQLNNLNTALIATNERINGINNTPQVKNEQNLRTQEFNSEKNNGVRTQAPGFDARKNAIFDKQDVLADQYGDYDFDIDNLKLEFKNLFSVVAEWRTLSQSLKDMSGKNATDVRKQVIKKLKNVSPELANMIGDTFKQALENGFKGIKTADLISKVQYVDNIDLLNQSSERLNGIRNLDLDSLTEEGLIDLQTNNVTDVDDAFYQILEKIVKKREEQLEIIKKLNEAQMQLFDVMGEETQYYNKQREESKTVKISNNINEEKIKAGFDRIENSYSTNPDALRYEEDVSKILERRLGIIAECNAEEMKSYDSDKYAKIEEQNQLYRRRLELLQQERSQTEFIKDLREKANQEEQNILNEAYNLHHKMNQLDTADSDEYRNLFTQRQELADKIKSSNPDLYNKAVNVGIFDEPVSIETYIERNKLAEEYFTKEARVRELLKEEELQLNQLVELLTLIHDLLKTPYGDIVPDVKGAELFNKLSEITKSKFLDFNRENFNVENFMSENFSAQDTANALFNNKAKVEKQNMDVLDRQDIIDVTEADIDVTNEDNKVLLASVEARKRSNDELRTELSLLREKGKIKFDKKEKGRYESDDYVIEGFGSNWGYAKKEDGGKVRDFPYKTLKEAKEQAYNNKERHLEYNIRDNSDYIEENVAKLKAESQARQYNIETVEAEANAIEKSNEIRSQTPDTIVELAKVENTKEQEESEPPKKESTATTTNHTNPPEPPTSQDNTPPAEANQGPWAKERTMQDQIIPLLSKIAGEEKPEKDNTTHTKEAIKNAILEASKYAYDTNKNQLENGVVAEHGITIFADGTVAVGDGNAVTTDKEVSYGQRLANIDKNVLMSAHTHNFLKDGYNFVDMGFSQSDFMAADVAFMDNSSKAFAMFTGKIIQLIDLTDVSYNELFNFNKALEKELNNLLTEYPQWFGEGATPGSIGLKRLTDPTERDQAVSKFLEAQANAAKTAGIESPYFNRQYDITNAQDVNELVNRLMQLSQQSQSATSDVGRLANILKELGADVNNQSVIALLNGFKGGALSVEDVIRSFAAQGDETSVQYGERLIAEMNKSANLSIGNQSIQNDEQPISATLTDEAANTLAQAIENITNQKKVNEGSDEPESTVDKATMGAIAKALENINPTVIFEAEGLATQETVSKILNAVDSINGKIVQGTNVVETGDKAATNSEDASADMSSENKTVNKDGSINHGKAKNVVDYYYWIREQMEQYKDNARYVQALNEVYNNLTPEIEKFYSQIENSGEEEPGWLMALEEKFGLHMAKIQGGQEKNVSIEKQAIEYLKEEYDLQRKINGLREDGATEKELEPLTMRLKAASKMKDDLLNLMSKTELKAYENQATSISNKEGIKVADETARAEVKARKKAEEEDWKRTSQEKITWDTARKEESDQKDRDLAKGYAEKEKAEKAEEKELEKLASAEDVFRKKSDEAYDSVVAWEKSLESSGEMTDDIKEKINSLKESLDNVYEAESFEGWKKQFADIKNGVTETIAANKKSEQDKKQALRDEAKNVNALIKLYEKLGELKAKIESAQKEEKDTTGLSTEYTNIRKSIRAIRNGKDFSKYDSLFDEAKSKSYSETYAYEEQNKNNKVKAEADKKAKADAKAQDQERIAQEKEKWDDLLKAQKEYYDAQKDLENAANDDQKEEIFKRAERTENEYTQQLQTSGFTQDNLNQLNNDKALLDRRIRNKNIELSKATTEEERKNILSQIEQFQNEIAQKDQEIAMVQEKINELAAKELEYKEKINEVSAKNVGKQKDSEEKEESRVKKEIDDLYALLGKQEAIMRESKQGAEYDKAKSNYEKTLNDIEKKIGPNGDIDEAGLKAYEEALAEQERIIANEQKIKEQKQKITKSKQAAKLGRADTVIENSTRLQGNLNVASERLGIDPTENETVAKFNASLEKLKELRDEISAKADKGEIITQQEIDDLKQARNETDDLSKKVKGLYAEIQDLDDDQNIGETVTVDEEGYKSYLENLAKELTNGKAKIGDFDAETNTLNYTLRTGMHEVTSFSLSIRDLDKGITQTTKSTKYFETFVDGIIRKTKEIGQYLAGSLSVNRLFQEVKQGIQYVKEIDAALTELKKVTDETDESYEKFIKTASKTAGIVGSTIKDVVSSTADWARLGYSLEQAAQLAESTQILLNVSEFSSINDATSALISTMQAFGYAAEDSMHVVDIMNEIGNNYAVSSDGIATALQDSASSLMTANNSYQEAVALVAAANKVVQDPNSVGAALRTISLRLRGTSTEELEESGEDTTGVVTSKSKLRSKIKTLSGIDILTDTGAYKSTYEILLEISKVWNEMSDVDQAALLEIIAGKTRSNAAAAILSNTTDLENAYVDALNAEGK